MWKLKQAILGKSDKSTNAEQHRMIVLCGIMISASSVSSVQLNTSATSTYGGWSAWSAWGSCSVTCGVGLRRQDRVCDNPWPTHDGHHCLGENINFEICARKSCSAWSEWGQWSACSNTCGYGQKVRTRICRGPPDSMPCVGSDVDKDMCETSCNALRPNGGWSTWSDWNSCSVTCGVGLRRRDRVCDNPWPTGDGHHCLGDNINYEICTETSCSAWSEWGQWSACSNTCGYGQKVRTRNCKGPPDQMSCLGSDVDKDICERSCNALRHEETSAFTAHYVEGSGKPLIFSRTKLNIGNDYNTSTGVFTCRVAGIYYFMISLEKARDAVNNYVVAIMLIKGTNTLYSHVRVNDAGNHMLGTSGTFHLVRGDTVSISRSPASYFSYNGGAFTGFLIRPDSA